MNGMTFALDTCHTDTSRQVGQMPKFIGCGAQLAAVLARLPGTKSQMDRRGRCVKQHCFTRSIAGQDNQFMQRGEVREPRK